MKTLGQILKLSCEYIENKNSSHTKRAVEELLAHTLGFKRLDLFLNFEKPLTEDELVRIRQNVSRLAQNEPLQYIEEFVDFYGCKIHVDKRVLIPRPETEILVDKILSEIPQKAKLWDVCTGSGCIGIALKKAKPSLQVTLSDISQNALVVARNNAEINNVEIDTLQGDMLDPFVGQTADYIICNPPYISEVEYETLQPHVRQFEPKQALVSGKTGLECYERLIIKLSEVIHPGSVLWLEIGHEQGKALTSLFSSIGHVQVLKDLSESDRFIRVDCKENH